MNTLRKYKLNLTMLLFVVFTPLLWLIINQGYWIQLDAVFTPYNYLLNRISPNSVIESIIYIGSSVLGGEYVWRLIFILTLLLPIIAGYTWIKSLAIERSKKTEISILSKLGYFFVATSLVFNPFIFERLLAGQWQFVIGFALFIHFLSNIRASSFKKLYILGITTLFSGHFGMVIAVSMCLYSLYPVILNLIQNLPLIDKMIPRILVQGDTRDSSSISTRIFNITLNLIIPLTYIILASIYSLSRIGAEDISIFWTNTGLNNLLGYGFWGQHSLDFPSLMNVEFWFLTLIIAVLGVTLHTIRTKSVKSFIVLALSYISSWILLEGTTGLFGGVYLLLYEAGLLRAFREPGKFIFIIAIVMFLGLSYFYLHSKYSFIKFIVFMLLVTNSILFIQSFVPSFNIVKYPAEITEANDYLSKQEGVLILPWQKYYTLDWIGSRSGDFSEKYFNTNVIASTSFRLSQDEDFENEYTSNNFGDFAPYIQLANENNVNNILVYKIPGSNWENIYSMGLPVVDNSLLVIVNI